MTTTLPRKLTLSTLMLLISLHMFAEANTVTSVSEAGQEITIDEKDRVASDSVFHPSERLGTLDRIKGTHPDGVKGFEIRPHLEGGFVSPDDRSQQLWTKACRLQVFGIYELEKKKSFPGKDNIGIFTKFRFKLIEDWRGGVRSGHKYLHLVTEGGEIEYKGEKLRVDNSITRYTIGKRYLLLTGTRGNDDSNLVVYSYSPFIEVSNGMLYPAPNVNIFAPGTSLSTAHAEIADALKERNCE
jgi:hypothetical protein